MVFYHFAPLSRTDSTVLTDIFEKIAKTGCFCYYYTLQVCLNTLLKITARAMRMLFNQISQKESFLAETILCFAHCRTVQIRTIQAGSKWKNIEKLINLLLKHFIAGAGLYAIDRCASFSLQSPTELFWPTARQKSIHLGREL